MDDIDEQIAVAEKNEREAFLRLKESEAALREAQKVHMDMRCILYDLRCIRRQRSPENTSSR